MSDGNPAFMAYVCAKCPCCNTDTQNGESCNLGYEVFETVIDTIAAELDKCLLTSVKWRGGSFEPVPVLVQRRVYEPYPVGRLITGMR